jgi:hypothetical protein
VGKLLVCAVGWGDAEGEGVEKPGPLVELQPVKTNKQHNNLNMNFNVFGIPYPLLLTSPSTQGVFS